MKSMVGSLIMAGYRAFAEPARAFRLRRPRLALYGLDPDDPLPTVAVDPYRAAGCAPTCSFHRGTRSVAVDLYLERAEAEGPIGPLGRLRRRTRLTPTVIEIARYPDMAALEAVIRKRSSRTLSKARRAREAGYEVRRFGYARHAADVEAVRTSTSVRAGGPVVAYWLGDKDLPEPPRGKARPKRPGCDNHWTQWWGVFLPEPDRVENGRTVGERLVAYVKINRRGGLAHYADIMGHAAHLDGGVMVLMHLELMRLFIEGGDPMVAGVRVVLYGGAEHGGEGLLVWKKRAGFEPMRLVEADTHGSDAGVEAPAHGLTS